MTKISIYKIDQDVQGNDKWIGSDAQNQYRTKNFTPTNLAYYFNTNQIIDIGTSVRYMYDTLDIGDTRQMGTLSFETEIGPVVNFSSISTFLLSKYALGNNNVSEYLTFLTGSNVIISKASDINVFGYFTIDSVEPYIVDPNFFVVNLSFISGNGFIKEDFDYLISLVDFGGGGGLFLGSYDSLLLLEAAHPTAENGSYAFINQMGDDLVYFYSTDGDYWWTITSGGSQTLAETLVLGNITDGTDISISDGDAVILDNGSKLKKGTTNAGNGGNNGIALKCSLDYEFKWEAGRMYIMEQDGIGIRETRYNFNVSPTITDDTTKGFAVNSRWILDNGDLYVCTDATTGSAVWELLSNGVPTLQQVTDNGNTTTNEIIVQGITIKSDGFANTQIGDYNGGTGITEQTAIGFEAGFGSIGDNQVAVGRGAGNTNEGYGQVAIGRNAGGGNTGNANISIGSSDTGNGNTGHNATLIGDGAGSSNIYNDVNIFGYGGQASANKQTVFKTGDYNVRFNTDVSANKLFDLPTSNTGTLALLSDIPSYSVPPLDDVLQAGNVTQRGMQIKFINWFSLLGGYAQLNGELCTTGNSPIYQFQNKATGSYQLATLDDIPIGGGTVTSVDLTMPAAFTVSGNPITSSGTLAVTAVGSASQYVRGDGQLATLPSNASGGSAISYYLNGGTAASVATYYQMSKTAVVGTSVDFSLAGNGLISQWLTDVADPNRLEIPAGNWNFEMYMSASSSGGTPAFYVELLKYDGVTFTTIANSSVVPEAITSGTLIDLYLTSLAIPYTTLTIADRLAVRVYIVNSTGGRTITMHTQDSHLCQIITNFAGGIAALNGLVANTQYFAVGTSGTDFAISSITDTHTFNLPTASATNRGALSSVDWSTFNNKAIRQIKLSSQTLTTASWTLVGLYYQYTFSNANIVTTGYVNFTPNNASALEVTTCKMLPQIDSNSGTCTFYSMFPPQNDIVGEIIIYIL